MPALELIGRQSSHYTRVARIFAHELGLAPRFEPILDLMAHDAGIFAGNPALRLPILRIDGEPVFGTANICRCLARAADAESEVFWPEQADTPLLMNAHELLSQAMAAQVEVVMHDFVARRPPDVVSEKRRQGLVDSVAWLDRQLEAVLASLPRKRLRWFEVALFCLVEHFPFRNPIELGNCANLTAFAAAFGQRPSATATPYRYDQR